MINRTIPCRVCGKMFVPCNKPSAVIGAFNYHSLACSPECGAEYLRRVQAARQQTNDANSTELEGQISFVEETDIKVADEISENTVEETAEVVVETKAKTYRSRKSKQED